MMGEVRVWGKIVLMCIFVAVTRIRTGVVGLNSGNNTSHSGVKGNPLAMETLGVPNNDGACGTLSTSRRRERGQNRGYGTAEGTR